MNRRPIRYDFHFGAKAIRYSGNMVLVYIIFIFIYFETFCLLFYFSICFSYCFKFPYAAFCFYCLLCGAHCPLPFVFPLCLLSFLMSSPCLNPDIQLSLANLGCIIRYIINLQFYYLCQISFLM